MCKKIYHFCYRLLLGVIEEIYYLLWEYNEPLSTEFILIIEILNWLRDSAPSLVRHLMITY